MDPKNLGSIGALDAANFLKKSGLHTSVLGKVFCALSLSTVFFFFQICASFRYGTCLILKVEAI